MNRKMTTAMVFACLGAMVACDSSDMVIASTGVSAPEQGMPSPAVSPPAAPTTEPDQPASAISVDSEPSGPPRMGAPATRAMPDMKSGGDLPDTTDGQTDASAIEPAASDAGAAADHQPIPLPSEITNVDVTQDTTRRFGAPHVAVNPSDPNNIVVLASSNLGYTRACVPPTRGSDCEMIPVGEIPLLTQPRGFARTPGFMDIGVFVSFDRGQTFEQIDIADLVPPGHPEVRARGEGPIAATMDGTFYIGFNAINWGNWESEPRSFFPNGGVGVIKSTDGGRSWQWVSYSGTPADWPYGGADLVTGRFYVTSGLAGISNLGPRSTGLPDSPPGQITDRWISSTLDGTTWTEPQPLGGPNGRGHMGANHSSVAAANGTMATLFLKTDRAGCTFFGGSSARPPCVVFQTSTDSGATWSRHHVPTPTGFTPAALSVLLGADPTREGHFTVVLLDESGAEFSVYKTKDAGVSWTGPVKVTEDPAKTHFAPFVANSPNGEFGIMWRSYERDMAGLGARPPFMPYSVWAVISRDGGETFSRPLRVSLANSPSPPNDPSDSFSIIGDHGPSGMAMDGDGGVYVVWADWTPGERAIFFSAIRAEAFEF
ncbi:MAG: hypothetical protein OXU20_34900 [Myxococcales bacterium]|nr:hypothetical protein [Myxococcales bacterium]